MRRSVILLLVPLLACKKDDKILPALLDPVEATALGVAGGVALGVGSASFPVLGVNGLGAPVDAGTLVLSSTGTLDPTTVTLDATGWGSATLAGPPGRHEVTLSGGTMTSATAVFLTNRPVPTAGFPAADGVASEEGLVAAGGGLVGAQDAVLRWAPLDGRPSVPVGTTVSATLGMLPATFDDDGVGDLVAWSADSLLVLRGRSGGGLTFAAGWKADGAEIVAAAPAELDQDGDGDLVVLVEEEGAARGLWLLGDGAGNFELTDALELDYGAWSLSAEDLDGDGDAEVTILTEDGLVNRYARFEGSWTLSGNLAYDLDLAAGHRLYPARDLDGDDVADLLLYGPVAGGSSANAWVVSAGGTGVVYQLFAESSGREIPASVQAITADLDGDGLDEVLLSTDTTFARASWSADADTFGVYDYGSTPTARPLAAEDFDGDGLGDVAMGGSAAVVLPGESVADDPGTSADETVPWKIRTPDTLVSDLDLVAPPVGVDRDDDGALDLVALTANAEGLSVTVYAGRTSGSVGFDREGAVLLAAEGVALDLAVCGGTVLALWEDSATTWLSRFTLGATGSPAAVGAAAPVSGGRVVCGSFGEGFDAAVVHPATGQVILLAPGGDQADGGALGPVVEVAAGDADGDGVDTLATCAIEGCSIDQGDLDGDGLDEVATLAGGRLSVAWGAGGEASVVADGVVNLQDADGDGRLDLTAADAGLVRSWRADSGHLSPGVASYLYRPALGPAWFGDLGADGILDVLLLGFDADPASDPDWVGTVIYAAGDTP